MSGRILVFEGIDGAGKDTQIQLTADYLQKRKIPYHIVKYPDISRPIGAVIDKFLHKEINLPADAQTLLFLADMLKDRTQIQEWLSEGATLLFNRHIFISTLAYQGAQALPLEAGKTIIQLLDFPKPDKIFFLNISADTSLKRKRSQKSLDRFESQTAFQSTVLRLYQRLKQERYLAPWIEVNGEQSPERVFQDIANHL